ncbi:hypothetical protein K4A83_15280 [Spirulina subsalsa FACHB-351]|uniref:Uncharacterized protein n=1 Tax=Spirulina subsalsa FACHB-351 TaxID=234711 RepID=A0ABT3L7Y7_9CYAN|nr:hypothetical protein [Spirulina subsalsa]MCW6037627.1 hypothetical protein [Spirulina subsalsa FACHB-351]
MLKPLRTLTVSFLFSLGFWLTFATSAQVNAISFPKIALNFPRLNKPQKQPPTPVISPWRDGIYHYGQSQNLNQHGATYLVLKVQQGRVNGALYQLDSEFSCVRGNLDNQRLNLRVQDVETNEFYSYNIPLQDRAQIASEGSLPRVLGLEGYYPLEQGPDLEIDLLAACAG